MMHKPEIFSALLDDEGSPEELANLDALAADDEIRSLWSRYQFIGDTLRAGDGKVFTAPRFSADIRALLEREPAHGGAVPPEDSAVIFLKPTLTSRASTAGRVEGIGWRPAIGLAVAASVMAFMLGLWSGDPTVSDAPLAAGSATALPAVAQTVATVATPSGASDSGSVEQVSSLPEAEYRRRMDNYLMNFNEQRARMGMPQAHAYVRVVGFDTPIEQR